MAMTLEELHAESRRLREALRRGRYLGLSGTVTALERAIIKVERRISVTKRNAGGRTDHPLAWAPKPEEPR